MYDPENPCAKENGMVTKEEYYQYKYLKQPDCRMFRGNEPVVIRFISDTMEPTRHMVDGKYYTSKKKFRNETKARGCIEVGNEAATVLKPRKQVKPNRRQRRDDIKKAIYDIKNGYNTFKDTPHENIFKR